MEFLVELLNKVGGVLFLKGLGSITISTGQLLLLLNRKQPRRAVSYSFSSSSDL
jgi:hypothetical protein